MTHGSQILLKPINISPLSKKNQAIWEKQNLTNKISIYQSDDNVFHTQGQLYRFVTGQRTIVGYMLLNTKEDAIYILELVSLNQNKDIENMMIETAIEIFAKSNSKVMRLSANQNIVLQYKNLGFKISGQKEINTTKIDEQIKNKTLELDNILMYLPTETIAKKIKEQNIIDADKLNNNQFIIGNLGEFEIYRKVLKSYLEEYGISIQNKVFGKIYLNFYKNSNAKYKNHFGIVPTWSDLYKYNQETCVDKIFAEFYSIKHTKRYDHIGMLYVLLQIALEVGKIKNCPRLQIYANKENALSLYKYGFMTQDITSVKSSEQLEILLNEAEKETAANINSFGMIEMELDKKTAESIIKSKIKTSKNNE